jgi:hypothetical protein
MTSTPGATPTAPDSPLDRRFLLGGLAGVATAVVASRAGAGPLNPPAGPVSNTGRTLDDIYNRVGTTGELRTVIPGGNGPYTISSPGSYVLAGNRNHSAAPLTISVSDVRLDLNGFTLTTSSTTEPCLNITDGASRVFVSNGTTVGGFYGVSLGNGVGVRLADVSVFQAIRYGVYSIGFGGGSGRMHVVERCTVVQTGLNSSATDTADVMGIRLSGSCGHVRDCLVLNTIVNGSGEVWGISCAGYGSVISGCTVSNPHNETTAFGVASGVNGVHIGNRVLYYANPVGAGQDGGNWPP